MNKSFFALLLVCAIVGMSYGARYNEVEEQDNEMTVEQVMKVLNALQEMEEQANQQSVGKKAKAQIWGTLAGLAGSALIHALGRK